MANILQIRRDTAANWTTYNPILHEGEPGLETDTLKIKYGDGVTAWNSLDYLLAGDSPAHEWSGTLLRFKNPDGTWGEWSDLNADISYKADIDSPAFTGTPTAPTAAVGTNTTQLATTAFVNSEISNDRPYATTNPLIDGTAAVGTSAKVAREDHVHPTDTSRAPTSHASTGTSYGLATSANYGHAKLYTSISDGVVDGAPDVNSVYDALALKANLASPALTGTPTAPTPSAGDNDTSIATTAFVNTEIANDTAYLKDFRVWSSTRTYAVNEPVFYNGVPYRSLVASNLNHTPSTNPTYWEVTGGGSDASNPGVTFENGQFESSSTGWTTYDDGAVTTPVDGTGGTPSYFTFARTATTPLIGTGSGLITKSAANAIGEGVSYDFTIDRGIVHEEMKIEFQYEASANYADGYIGVFLYDKTNAVLIPISVQDIPASYGKPGTFLATFIPSTSTSYRLIFHTTTTTTTSWTMMIDNVVVGNKDIAVGAAISEWRSYTPIVTGAGTLTDVACFWRRVGDSIEVSGRATAGTVSSVFATISLPSGLTTANYTINRIVGDWWRNAVVANEAKKGCIQSQSGQSSVVMGIDAELLSISPFTGQNFNALLPSGQVFSFRFSVRIAQWTSNVNLASDFTEYAYNYSTTTTSDSTSFAYGSEGAVFQAFAPTEDDAVVKLVKFQRPIQPTDIITLETLVAGGKWASFYNNNQFIGNFTTSEDGTTYYGASLNTATSDPSTIAVYFHSAPCVDISWASLASVRFRWRVRKTSNGNMAEVPPVVRAEYTALLDGSAYPIPWDYSTKIEDTHSAVKTGTSWKFTAPISGVYLIEGTGYISANTNLWLVVNGAKRRVQLITSGQYIPYVFTVRLVTGDYIAISTDSFGADLGPDASITITRIGS